MRTLTITKEGGLREQYSGEKFCASIARAGADPQLVHQVCRAVERGLKPGMTTADIFRRASRLLIKHNPQVAARYNLKKGIRELGPAGFLFEQFVEVLLRSLGYKTRRNVFMQGRCVEHEIDVLARGSDGHFLIEAKFHGDPGAKVHIDIAMYAYARLLDIAARQRRREPHTVRHTMWLFTNTKFTSKAIAYGKCMGVRLTGWRYPHNGSLEQLVSRFALYPITVLPSLTRSTRKILARNGIMLAQDLAPYSPRDLVKKLGVRTEEANALVREAQALVFGAS